MLPVNMLFWLIQISCGLFDAPRQHVVLVDTNILWVVDAPRQHVVLVDINILWVV